MTRMANSFAGTKRFDPATLVGFLVPVGLAVLIGLIIHAYSQPIGAPVRQETNASGAVTATTPVDPPTEAEIAVANQTILSYCSNDLRKDTSCSLIAGSTVTAPGFIETGLKMSGSFATDGTSAQGVALAKGSGTSWAVVWVGQSCIPKDVATQNSVPGSFKVCSS
jgi:hypothetical protein